MILILLILLVSYTRWMEDTQNTIHTICQRRRKYSCLELARDICILIFKEICVVRPPLILFFPVLPHQVFAAFMNLLFRIYLKALFFLNLKTQYAFLLQQIVLHIIFYKIIKQKYLILLLRQKNLNLFII